MELTSRERFLRAFSGEPVDRPPVWLMRQAGRYLPDYRSVRAAHPFWEVCRTPELSTRVALEPMRKYALDASIVFSDILVVPQALGLDVTFGTGDGPKVGKPLRTREDLAAWQRDGVLGRLQYVIDAVVDLRKALGDRYGLLGFGGAPWTLFCYAVDGGSSEDFRHARTMLLEQPELARDALAVIADVVADLLEAECDAGVDAVQLFDTWGGLLDREDYEAFALPAIQRITQRLRARGRRSILFVRDGHHLLPILHRADSDAVSIDRRTPWADARAALPGRTLQGNADPLLLLSGVETARAAARKVLRQIDTVDQGRRAIVNLGHGILPGTPEDAVGAFVDEVIRHGSGR